MEQLILVPVLLLLLFMSVFASERSEDTFYVKPGAGTLSVQAELKKYLCKFTYSAQGGTHEEWVLSLEVLDGGSAVMCTAERGVPSYLFFQDFKLELTGPMVSITDVDIKNSQRDKLSLGKEEYLLEKNAALTAIDQHWDHTGVEDSEFYAGAEGVAFPNARKFVETDYCFLLYRTIRKPPWQ